MCFDVCPALSAWSLALASPGEVQKAVTLRLQTSKPADC